MGQRRLYQARQRRRAEELKKPEEEEDEYEAAEEGHVTVDKEGLEEEAAEIIEEALGMEVEEEGKGEEGGNGTLRKMGEKEFLGPWPNLL